MCQQFGLKVLCFFWCCLEAQMASLLELERSVAEAFHEEAELTAKLESVRARRLALVRELRRAQAARARGKFSDCKIRSRSGSPSSSHSSSPRSSASSALPPRLGQQILPAPLAPPRAAPGVVHFGGVRGPAVLPPGQRPSDCCPACYYRYLGRAGGRPHSRDEVCVAHGARPSFVVLPLGCGVDAVRAYLRSRAAEGAE